MTVNAAFAVEALHHLTRMGGMGGGGGGVGVLGKGGGVVGGRCTYGGTRAVKAIPMKLTFQRVNKEMFKHNVQSDL